MRDAVSRFTSSTGISTAISRRVLLVVSVGLTFAFQALTVRTVPFSDESNGIGCKSECKDLMREASNWLGWKQGNKRNLRAFTWSVWSRATRSRVPEVKIKSRGRPRPHRTRYSPRLDPVFQFRIQ